MSGSNLLKYVWCILRHTALWLLLPVIVMRHKFKRISHYEVICDKGKNLECDNYLEAQWMFQAVSERDDYGDSVELMEVYYDGSSVGIMSLRW